MTDEEKKELIKKLKTIEDMLIEDNYQGFAGVINSAIDLIEKQDKIINIMSKEIEEQLGTCPFDAYEYEMENCQDCQNTYSECWKKYFSKKVGE